MADRRPRKRLTAQHRVVIDGSVVRKGQTIPRELPTKEKEKLVKHGYAGDHKNDTVNY